MNTFLESVSLELANPAPGAFVRLKGQPSDLPDFLLERHLDRYCWIRQQSWGPGVHWKVEVTRLEQGL